MTIACPKRSVSRTILWSCRIVVAAALAFAAGSAIARPLKRPDHFRPRAPAVEPAQSPISPTAAADKSPADALKAREQELDSLRTEQQRANENRAEAHG